MVKANTSLCKGKQVQKPNKCVKVSGCKVAKGTKRTFCRKKHNVRKNAAAKTQKKRGVKELAQLKGMSKNTERALKKLQ